MKKVLLIIIGIVLTLGLAACGNDDKTDSKKLVVGATSVPHAQILEQAKPILKEKGIELEIKVFNDYKTPNTALEEKDLDANYFQHIPYFDQQVKENNFKFTNAGAIHIEPLGIYSKKYKSLKDLPNDAKILISNSTSDHGRVLSLFEKEGLIKLKSGIDKTSAQLSDIVDNPKNFEFKADFTPEFLPQAYNNNEGDAVAINSNFALSVGINPMKDSIAIEGNESPYVNIVAVRTGDEKTEKIKTLVDVLHSKEIQDWIIKEYGGSVVPVK